ncbi:hypothetical protein GGS21DRAFT_491256 [Xylaria nigripes]|nr:hypothetical protein GGS21DRAFT_491256 [Xylaria nigripes]
MSASSRPSSRALSRSNSKIPVPVRRDSMRSVPSTPTVDSALLSRKHAALDADLELTPDEWRNVNARIKKTVDILISQGHIIQGPGPRTYGFTANLGIALVADIAIRPNQRVCSLADPVLQEKLCAMARDPAHATFRYTFLHGRVWFHFRVDDRDLAAQPLGEGEM